ncbi:hypothetical protein GGF31_002582 [Allomyces arbusculus]|nr:hypothetical protein GGF31_002582 [Allomyces arbusculus]
MLSFTTRIALPKLKRTTILAPEPTPSSGIPATWNPQRPTRDSLFAPFPATFTLLARAGVEVGSITLASNGSATIITTPPPATAIHIASAAQVAVLDAVAAQPLTTAAATWTYWTPSAESTLGRLELVAAPTGKKGAAARQVWAVTSATEDLPASRLRVEQVPLQEDAGVGLVPVGTVEMRRKKRS